MFLASPTTFVVVTVTATAVITALMGRNTRVVEHQPDWHVPTLAKRRDIYDSCVRLSKLLVPVDEVGFLKYITALERVLEFIHESDHSPIKKARCARFYADYKATMARLRDSTLELQGRECVDAQDRVVDTHAMVSVVYQQFMGSA